MACFLGVFSGYAFMHLLLFHLFLFLFFLASAEFAVGPPNMTVCTGFSLEVLIMRALLEGEAEASVMFWGGGGLTCGGFCYMIEGGGHPSLFMCLMLGGGPVAYIGMYPASRVMGSDSHYLFSGVAFRATWVW